MKKFIFQPDFNNLLDVMHNRKPKRLPLYEHIIDIPFIAKATGRDMVPQGNTSGDMEAFYSELIGFWRNMTYDGFAYEAAICEILPDHGAIKGGRPGPIQNRTDFENTLFMKFPGSSGKPIHLIWRPSERLCPWG